MNLEHLTNIAILAATKAGRYVEQAYSSELQQEHKSAGSSVASQVVTAVDRESQNIILGLLQPSIDKFDLGLLAEEDEDNGSRLTKDYFWCIDPLDGTLPYVEGRSGYAIAIALISKAGVPQVGVVYDPREDKCYSAYSGGGVFLNRRKFQMNRNKSEKKATIFHHRSLISHPEFNTILEQHKDPFVKEGFEQFEIISHGGAVMNAMWALEHQPSVYFALPKVSQGGGCIWDYAATACIYGELSCGVSDYYGKALHLNYPETIYMNKVGVLYQPEVSCISK